MGCTACIQASTSAHRPFGLLGIKNAALTRHRHCQRPTMSARAPSWGWGWVQELIGHAAAPAAQMAIRPPRAPSAALGILCKTPCCGLHAGSGDPLPCLPRQLLALAFKRRLVPHPDLHPSHWARICGACLAHCGHHRPALKAKCLPRSGAGLASPASLKGPAGCPKGLAPPPHEGTWQSTFGSAKRPPSVAACAPVLHKRLFSRQAQLLAHQGAEKTAAAAHPQRPSHFGSPLI